MKILRLLDYWEINKTKRLDWNMFCSFQNEEFDNLFLTPPDLLLDLRGLTYVEEDGLLWLSFILLCRFNLNRISRIALPEKQNCIDYIKRSKFPDLQHLLDFKYENEHLLLMPQKEYKPKDDSDEKIRHLHIIKTSNHDSTIANYTKHIEVILIKYLGLDEDDYGEIYFEGVRPFTRMLEEITKNIILHSAKEVTDSVGLIVIVPPKSNRKSFTFVASDIGMGIRKSLSLKNKKYKDDASAIIYALLYRHIEPETGVYGLYHALKLINMLGGSISIRTGKSLSVLESFRDEDKILLHHFINDPTFSNLKKCIKTRHYRFMPGTHINVTLNLPDFN